MENIKSVLIIALSMLLISFSYLLYKADHTIAEQKVRLDELSDVSNDDVETRENLEKAYNELYARCKK